MGFQRSLKVSSGVGRIGRPLAHSLAVFALLAIAALVPHVAFSQQAPDFVGEFAGMLGPLHVKLHLTTARDGTLSGTVDSPDQNMFALPCADIHANGQALSFTVPMVRGTWTGLLSGDGSSLSGVWSQGSPIPLNLTRVTSAAATSATTPPATPPSAIGGAASTATIAVRQTSCGSTLAVNYWDGTGWKPMVITAHVGSERGVSLANGLKNPFNPSAGITKIVTLKNPTAALTLEPKPRFCIAVPVNFDPTIIMIGSLEVRKDHRELETCNGPCASKGRTADDWMPQKRVQPIDIKRISESLVEITPKNPLPTGQYILGGPPLVGYYDFGVMSANATQ